MANKVPQVLHQHINTAYPDFPCVVGTVLPDGYAQVTPRGSVVVLDDETMGFWNRGGGTTAANVADGSKITIFFRKPTIREILPAGGTARFYGTAEVHKSGPLCEKVWETMVQPERDRDPEKKGHAVIVRLAKAENLNGKPLA